MALPFGDLTQSDLSCGDLAPAAKHSPSLSDPIPACKELAQQLKHNMLNRSWMLHSNVSHEMPCNVCKRMLEVPAEAELGRADAPASSQ